MRLEGRAPPPLFVYKYIYIYIYFSQDTYGQSEGFAGGFMEYADSTCSNTLASRGVSGFILRNFW